MLAKEFLASPDFSAAPIPRSGYYGAAIDSVGLIRRFNAAIWPGTPDTIDLLVVCSEAGMGLESALERVAEEMNQSYPAMTGVLPLLDDLRILPIRREAFEKLGLCQKDYADLAP